MFYIILAILAGVCIVFSRIINFKLANQIGVFQGTLFNYIVGLIFSLALLLLSGERFLLEIVFFIAIPWWAYWGGFLGVVVVMLSTYLTPKLSAFYLTMFIFIGQLFIGGLIDYLTQSEFSVGKIIGGAMVLVGLAYNMKLDEHDANIEDTK